MNGAFSIGYRTAAGQLVSGPPRLVISTDGTIKSLVLGEEDNVIIASVPYDTSDAQRWQTACAFIEAHRSGTQRGHVHCN